MESLSFSGSPYGIRNQENPSPLQGSLFCIASCKQAFILLLLSYIDTPCDFLRPNGSLLKPLNFNAKSTTTVGTADSAGFSQAVCPRIRLDQVKTSIFIPAAVQSTLQLFNNFASIAALIGRSLGLACRLLKPRTQGTSLIRFIKQQEPLRLNPFRAHSSSAKMEVDKAGEGATAAVPKQVSARQSYVCQSELKPCRLYQISPSTLRCPTCTHSPCLPTCTHTLPSPPLSTHPPSSTPSLPLPLHLHRMTKQVQTTTLTGEQISHEPQRRLQNPASSTS